MRRRRPAPDLGRVIAKLDNCCSVLFCAGLLIVIVFVYSTLLGGTVTGLAYLLAQVLNHGQGMKGFFWALMAVFVLIPLTAGLIDKRYGERMSPQSRGYRVIRGMRRFTYTMNMMHVLGPMMWTLITNVGRKRSMAREHGMRFQYYETQREEGESYTRIPSIQSDIIRDPYVKLFIPFSPFWR